MLFTSFPPYLLRDMRPLHAYSTANGQLYWYVARNSTRFVGFATADGNMQLTFLYLQPVLCTWCSASGLSRGPLTRTSPVIPLPLCWVSSTCGIISKRPIRFKAGEAMSPKSFLAVWMNINGALMATGRRLII
jgi:hypothetical protein